MKKIEYKAPETEVIEMKYTKMLMASGEEAGGGGSLDPTDDPDE